jgi:two-component system, sensor histidine kinase and response regulator
VTPTVDGAPTLREPSAPRRVLLVEDNVVSRLLATRFLEDTGHSVVAARNGCEALERLSSEAFDLVLMDIEMPVLGGLEAIARIRAAERVTGGHVPIVALTGGAAPDDRARCLAAGSDGYVAKPFTSQALEAAVTQLSGGRALPVALPTLVDPTDRVRAPVDLGLALETCGGDEPLRREVTAEVLRTLPEQVAALARAVRSGDATAVARGAHKVKSSLAAVGALPASDAAQELERAAREGDARMGVLEGTFAREAERAAAALERSLRP